MVRSCGVPPAVWSFWPRFAPSRFLEMKSLAAVETSVDGEADGA